jgi:Putative MetA-pathway of phenol degradation
MHVASAQDERERIMRSLIARTRTHTGSTALVAFCFYALAPLCPAAESPDGSANEAAGRQVLEDAWWTGPILAASASTLPQGHFLIEPYLYDSVSYARFDAAGDRHDTPDTHFLGSQTYLLYGLFDKVSVGLIPRFGFLDAATGRDSSGIRVGDVSLQGQYRLTQFDGVVPTTSIVMQTTLPTGKHDRLGERTSDGMGSGAYSMTLGLYSQHFFWLPNGRILRTRLNVSRTFSDNADVADVSVYRTEQGFRGRAEPGDSLVIIAAGEYSVTRNWVAALDLQYQRDGRTRVFGYAPTRNAVSVRADQTYSSRRAVSLAPAVEYNFNGNVGIIVGAIWTVAGRNTGASVIPVAAINIVY